MAENAGFEDVSVRDQAERLWMANDDETRRGMTFAQLCQWPKAVVVDTEELFAVFWDNTYACWEVLLAVGKLSAIWRHVPYRLPFCGWRRAKTKHLHFCKLERMQRFIR
jgi:hypothetical protein